MKKRIPKYHVYDEVWVMHNNVPKAMLVFSIKSSMDKFKTGVKLKYNLVESIVWANFGNNSGLLFEEESIFASKKELVESLL